MKTLQDYIDSGELPESNPELLAKLLAEANGEIPAELVEPEPPKEPESAATSVVEDKEPDGILSKDGKHVIPYDALKSERQARQSYQNQTAELQRQIDELKAGKAVNVDHAKAIMSDDQLEELKEYFPEQYEAIVSQQEALNAAANKLAVVEQREQQRIADEARQVSLTVQEEIDNNPILSHWQRNNPEIWAECVALDNAIRSNPANEKLSMSERFDKVAKAMVQVHESPVSVEPPKPAPTATVKADVKRPPINSLSELKGGEAPEASDKEKLESMDANEISGMLMKMSPEQQSKWLAANIG